MRHTLVVDELVQALSKEEAPQSFHFPFQLSDQFGVGVFVDDGITADLLGSVGVPAAAAQARSGQSG